MGIRIFKGVAAGDGPFDPGMHDAGMAEDRTFLIVLVVRRISRARNPVPSTGPHGRVWRVLNRWRAEWYWNIPSTTRTIFVNIDQRAHVHRRTFTTHLGVIEEDYIGLMSLRTTRGGWLQKKQ